MGSHHSGRTITWGAWLAFRHRSLFQSPLFLRALVVSTPLGFIATEAGWVATEVGRQPWVIVGFLKTAEAVTPMPGLTIPLMLFAGLYAFLTCIVIWLMRRHIAATPKYDEGTPPLSEAKTV